MKRDHAGAKTQGTASKIVSIIIPTYNRGLLLKRALESVVDQTYPHWEVLVVDNHSEDETDKIVNDFNDSRISLYKIHNNGIIASSRNLGIKAAQGEWVAFLDSDDWWGPQKLAESVRALEQGADVVYHDLYLVRAEHQRWYWIKVKTFQLHAPVSQDLIERGASIINSSVVTRKSLIEKVGGFPEEKVLVGWEDYYCWLRVAKYTDRFVRLNKTLGYYWEGGENFTLPERTLRNLQEFQQRYLQKRSGNLPASFCYAMGRTLYQLGRYNEAKQYLLDVIGSHPLFEIKLKAVVTLAIIGLREIQNVFKAR